LCKAGGAVVINIETTVGPSNRRNGIFRLTADIQVQPLQSASSMGDSGESPFDYSASEHRLDRLSETICRKWSSNVYHSPFVLTLSTILVNDGPDPQVAVARRSPVQVLLNILEERFPDMILYLTLEIIYFL